MKTQSRCSGRDTAGRAIEQADPEPSFEVADGLAQSGRRQTEMIRRAREARSLDYRGKGLELGKFRSAHYELFS